MQVDDAELPRDDRQQVNPPEGRAVFCRLDFASGDRHGELAVIERRRVVVPAQAAGGLVYRHAAGVAAGELTIRQAADFKRHLLQARQVGCRDSRPAPTLDGGLHHPRQLLRRKLLSAFDAEPLAVGFEVDQLIDDQRRIAVRCRIGAGGVGLGVLRRRYLDRSRERRGAARDEVAAADDVNAAARRVVAGDEGGGLRRCCR